MLLRSTLNSHLFAKGATAVVGHTVTLCEGGFRKEARSRLNPGLNVGCAKGFGENSGSATFVFHEITNW